MLTEDPLFMMILEDKLVSMKIGGQVDHLLIMDWLLKPFFKFVAPITVSYSGMTYILVQMFLSDLFRDYFY